MSTIKVNNIAAATGTTTHVSGNLLVTGSMQVTGNVHLSGNLTVLGTTTTVNSTTFNVTSSITFEGPQSSHETTLGVTDPTADATINLPAMSAGTYHVPVLAAASTTAISSTPAELNLLDGSAKSTSSITIADADAFIVIDGTTTKQIPASDIKTYAGGVAADDITVGDAAVSIRTTSGNITIDADAGSINVTGSTLTLSGSDNVIIRAKNSSAQNAIVLSASAGGIDMNAAGPIHMSGSTFTVSSSATTDGSDGAGSILLSASLGGIGLAWSDGKDLWAEGGRFVVVANENASEAIKLHADAGANQTIQIINDAGTADGAEGSGAIDIEATVGGISLHAADDKDIAIEAGQVVLTANHNTAGAIKLHADAGAAQSIEIINDAGSAHNAIVMSASAGGIDINAAGAIHMTGSSHTVTGSGNITLDSTYGQVVFGVDDTGVDVRIFSATASEGVLYDASEDELALLLTTKLKFHDVGGGEEIFASSNGHLEINAGTTLDMTAPTVDINASTAVTIDGPSVVISSATSTKPLVEIKNTNADANGSTLQFTKDGSSVADSDVVGNITFVSEDDGSNAHTYASVIASISDASAGTEGGKLELKVAEHDGTVTSGLTLQDGSADGEIDATIGAGAASVVTVPGVLSVANDIILDDGGSIKEAGGTAAITINSDGEITTFKVPAANVAQASDHILFFDGGATGSPKVESIDHFLTAIAGSGVSVSSSQLTVSAGATAADDISTGDGAVSIATTSGNITIDAQANDADVIIKVDDNGSSVTAVTFDGSDEGNAIFVNDLKLSSDSAAIHWGANNEVTLTHEHNLGLILEGNGVTACPVLTLKNTNNDATGGTLKFLKDGSNVADADVIGNIDFTSEDDGDNAHTYARILAKVDDMTGGQEEGSLEFHVAEYDGTLTKGMDIVGLGSDGNVTVDITTHDGAAGGLKLGGTLVTSTAAELNVLDAVTRGSIVYGNASGATALLSVGSNGQVLTTDGTDISWGSGGNMSSFFLEDGDGTEVEIDNAKEVKFVEGTGIDINWTDTSHGSDSDPYDLTFSITTDLLLTDIKIGEDDNTKIDFGTTQKIQFYANGTHELTLEENAFLPNTNDGVALGKTAKGFSDVFLASGGVVGWHSNDCNITHSSNTLTVNANTLVTSADLTVGDDLNVTDNISLTTDSSVISMGDGSDATFTHDGTTGLVIAANPIHLDSGGALALDSATGDIDFQDGGTSQLSLDMDGSAGEIIMQLKVNGDDLVFKQYDGNEVCRITDEGSLVFKTDDQTAMAFGDNAEITITHEHNTGLILTNTLTGDNKPMILTLKSEENAVIADETIGGLHFKGGDSDGTDAILTCAAVEALATDTHAADNNAAALIFKTAASEAATEKMRIGSDGKVGIGVSDPDHFLEILDGSVATGQLKLSYDASNGVTAGSDSGGNMALVPKSGKTLILSSYESVSAAGSDQSGAAAITRFYNTVTGADGSKGIRLPTGAITGMTCHINNSGGSNLKVYPPSGQQINAGSTNAAVTQAGGAYVMFVYTGSNIWGSWGTVS